MEFKIITLAILLIKLSIIFAYSDLKRCGRTLGIVCPEGYCCSKRGYCGKTDEYCFVGNGCQRLYGKCQYTLKDVSNKNNYIITILRDENDLPYDKETEEVQYAIDELVNERMNDIYQIIYDFRDTYGNDEKLDELNENFPLPENKKFKFINPLPWRRGKFEQTESDDYISISSNLVSHICPISNTYSILAYLSDNIVKIVKTLPNIKSVEVSNRLEID